MTDDGRAPIEAPQKAGHGDLLPSLAETVPQIPREADVEGLIGGAAGVAASAPLGATGHRDRSPDARLGRLNPRLPKPRTGSRFPPFPEARKTTGKALVRVIQEA